MKYSYTFVLIISWISCTHTQKFEDISAYRIVRLMDLKVHEWKPDMLDKMEKVLDAELKYSDEKQGIACKSIDFEQQADYPKQENRFLDLSFRALCTDEDGKMHDIEKNLLTVAIERKMAEVNAVLGATVYQIDNVPMYVRDRNRLNLIIIPISVGLVIILTVLTFVLRYLRNAQKRRHIVSELSKKKNPSINKGSTTANVDPHATEKQRLLQLDPTVVGSASDTLGSPKEFTNEAQPSPFRGTGGSTTHNRQQKDDAPFLSVKDNRSPHNNRNNDDHYVNQRPTRQGPFYENEPRDAIPLQEQQPRVVVRTIRNDDRDYDRQQNDSSMQFVPIPVHVERSGPQQRFVSPPYHSDPYYRHDNA